MPTDPPDPSPPEARIDSDVDLTSPQQRRELAATHGAVLLVIAAGGSVGALGRYGLTSAWPAAVGGFPWAIFVINVVGSFLLGALMVVITELRPSPHPLARPFFGVGVLGGFTTFSTYANDIRALLAAGTALVGAAYLATTLIAAVTASALGIGAARTVGRVTRKKERR